ncbi:MAG: tRNA (guanosine(37)-N1)-methyltransferase TrmD [Verrucomicrobiota bacterium JB022]|nr:tRNA (guanosine(37)-N1)-methyltransferase TrmD [Verrucomicrobiota bacterium JB022]
MLTIDVLTLFPNMLNGFVSESMIGRAQKNGLIQVTAHQLRNWATDKWSITDDRPFGGGAGMLLKPEPLFAAIEELKKPQTVAVYLTPDGEPLSTPMVRELAQESHLLLVSGHYEGIDQRVRDCLIDREVSIGDYVLTNGTLPAAVMIDAVCRYVPGVLGEEKSLTQDSFSDRLLGFPQYTRPVDFRGMRVPEILLSGDHAKIEGWRQERRLEKTKQRRPDLLP